MGETGAPVAVPPGAVTRTGPFQALGHRFVVETTESPLATHVTELFAALRHDGAQDGAAVYSLVDTGQGSHPYVASIDGARIRMSSKPHRLLDALIWKVNMMAVERTPERLLLHAAAAARDGAAVIMPGASGAGKTTLVTGLVSQGLAYVTDEVVAVDPENLTIAPFPKPVQLKPGARAVFPALAPAVAADQERYLPQQWIVPPARLNAAVPDGPVTPAVVVFPAYRSGAGTDIRPLRGPEAVERAARLAYQLARHPQRDLETIAALARRCRCYRLVSGDLGSACEAVADLLSSR